MITRINMIQIERINNSCRFDKYLERMIDRSDLQIGITFDEFRRFYQFLNNLDDFSIAMQMYTLADHPISKGI